MRQNHTDSEVKRFIVPFPFSLNFISIPHNLNKRGVSLIKVDIDALKEAQSATYRQNDTSSPSLLKLVFAQKNNQTSATAPFWCCIRLTEALGQHY